MIVTLLLGSEGELAWAFTMIDIQETSISSLI